MDFVPPPSNRSVGASYGAIDFNENFSKFSVDGIKFVINKKLFRL